LIKKCFALTLQEGASGMGIEKGLLKPAPAGPCKNLFRDHFDLIFCIGRVGG